MNSAQPCPDTAPPCNPPAPQATFSAANPARRKRGKSLSRRIGQDGNVFQRGFAKRVERQTASLLGATGSTFPAATIASAAWFRWAFALHAVSQSGNFASISNEKE